ncbi:hypothetical protein GALL_509300 [mine drainage metagenome]|uniref:Uncharacterized protein n=1 Tax=mine drainage metagenome TaxID=410659 RepID=A0A1J5PQD2_9ZZZZ
MPGQDDRFGQRCNRLDLRHHLQTIHVGQNEVNQRQRDCFVFRSCHSFGAVSGNNHFIALDFQDVSERLSQIRIIVHHQNFYIFFHHEAPDF